MTDPVSLRLPPDVIPSDKDRSEWSRLAERAYRAERNDSGHILSVAASIPAGTPVSIFAYERTKKHAAREQRYEDLEFVAQQLIYGVDNRSLTINFAEETWETILIRAARGLNRVRQDDRASR